MLNLFRSGLICLILASCLQSATPQKIITITAGEGDVDFVFPDPKIYTSGDNNFFIIYPAPGSEIWIINSTKSKIMSFNRNGAYFGDLKFPRAGFNTSISGYDELGQVYVIGSLEGKSPYIVKSWDFNRDQSREINFEWSKIDLQRYNHSQISANFTLSSPKYNDGYFLCTSSEDSGAQAFDKEGHYLGKVPYEQWSNGIGTLHTIQSINYVNHETFYFFLPKGGKFGAEIAKVIRYKPEGVLPDPEHCVYLGLDTLGNAYFYQFKSTTPDSTRCLLLRFNVTTQKNETCLFSLPYTGLGIRRICGKTLAPDGTLFITTIYEPLAYTELAELSRKARQKQLLPKGIANIKVYIWKYKPDEADWKPLSKK